MRLRKFRVRAFRCIHDSGEIKVGDLAAFVGRNESGKTTILEGLTLLNRDKTISELDLCDEMSEELKNEITIANGEFELTTNETQMIKEKKVTDKKEEKKKKVTAKKEEKKVTAKKEEKKKKVTAKKEEKKEPSKILKSALPFFANTCSIILAAE